MSKTLIRKLLIIIGFSSILGWIILMGYNTQKDTEDRIEQRKDFCDSLNMSYKGTIFHNYCVKINESSNTGTLFKIYQTEKGEFFLVP